MHSVSWDLHTRDNLYGHGMFIVMSWKIMENCGILYALRCRNCDNKKNVAMHTLHYRISTQLKLGNHKYFHIFDPKWPWKWCEKYNLYLLTLAKLNQDGFYLINSCRNCSFFFFLPCVTFVTQCRVATSLVERIPKSK